MATNVVRVIGLKEANRALLKLPDFARPRVQQEMDVTAFQVMREAQARVRRRTGFLSGRIRWRSRQASLAAVVGVDREAFYWKFVEYGTVKMPATPFMRPAADAVKADHDRRLIKALTEAARNMAQSAPSPTGSRHL